MDLTEFLRRVWESRKGRTGFSSWVGFRDHQWPIVGSRFKAYKESGFKRALRPTFNPEVGWRLMGEVDRGRAFKRGGGVYKLPSGRFQVVVRSEGKQRHMGVFDTEEKALEVLARHTKTKGV